MDLDQKIKESLMIKSEWNGSVTKMWNNISNELQPKKPWWQRQQFWFSTVTAAIAILILFLQTNKPTSPLQPIAEPESTQEQLLNGLPKVATFRTMLVEEPLEVRPSGEIDLHLNYWPTLETEEFKEMTLSVLHIEETSGSESLVKVISLNEGTIDVNETFAVIAPDKAGTYRLVIEGNLEINQTVHTIHASKLIKVLNEEGR
ncbi:MAG: hypothetical protein QM401_00260 [Bacillota bacterium]|nr:hypothetical protein [Bacillota bacterium]HHU61756.1 hypothetical protein [Natronincola sp.]